MAGRLNASPDINERWIFIDGGFRPKDMSILSNFGLMVPPSTSNFALQLHKKPIPWNTVSLRGVALKCTQVIKRSHTKIHCVCPLTLTSNGRAKNSLQESAVPSLHHRHKTLDREFHLELVIHLNSSPVPTTFSKRVPCTSRPTVKAVGGHNCPTVIHGAPISGLSHSTTLLAYGFSISCHLSPVIHFLFVSTLPVANLLQRFLSILWNNRLIWGKLIKGWWGLEPYPHSTALPLSPCAWRKKPAAGVPCTNESSSSDSLSEQYRGLVIALGAGMLWPLRRENVCTEWGSLDVLFQRTKALVLGFSGGQPFRVRMQYCLNPSTLQVDPESSWHNYDILMSCSLHHHGGFCKPLFTMCCLDRVAWFTITTVINFKLTDSLTGTLK